VSPKIIQFVATVIGLFLLMSGVAPGMKSAHASVAVDVAVGAAAGCGAAVATGMLTTSVAVSPHHLDFEALSGDFPSEPQAFGVRCIDVGDGSDCGGSISVDQPWLEIDHDRFFGLDTVGVRVDPGDLEPGIYEGRIHVEYDFVSVDDSEEISVGLVVDPPPPPP